MATWTFSFLGTFRVARDGQELSRFGSAKARALLAYLAVEAARPHARTSLCGLLWPELTDTAALHNLSHTLGRLRTAIGDTRDTRSLLHISRHTIQWNRAGSYRLDVDSFVRLAASSAVDERDQAAAVYRGAFLAGFSVPGCPEFEEWLLLTREHLERLALESLQLVAQQRLAAGAYRQAEAAARRQLEFDPWREAAHRQVMQALADAGQRAAALAQYAACVRTLDEQLGIAPEPETTALAGQIRAGAIGSEAAQPGARCEPSDAVGERRPAVPFAQVAGAETSRLARAHDWSEAPDTGVLYGRAAEAAQLEHWLLHERCRLVAVLGMGGVGKTTLAAPVARSVAGHFDRVVWRSLLNAPPLEELLRPVLQALAGPTLTELPAGLDAQLALLLDGLRTAPLFADPRQPGEPARRRRPAAGCAPATRAMPSCSSGWRTASTTVACC